MKKKTYLLFSIILLVGITAFLVYVFTANDDNNKNNETLTYSSTDFENRVYLLNNTLIGDETVNISKDQQNIKLDSSMITNFDTKTIGKRTAKISYSGEEKQINYYVIKSANDTSLNCISNVNNLFTTYYLNENLDLTNVSIEYCEVVDGYMVKSIIPVTLDMLQGFNTSSIGTKTLYICYKDFVYNFTYYVKEKSTEQITSNSFSLGTYYSTNTTEETTHFSIKINEGSYLPNDYKTIIEKMYVIQEEVSGLKFADKLTIEVLQKQHPACGGLTIYINASELFAVASNAFQHELAHALNHSQIAKSLPCRTLTEGFATYMEYLTSKQIREKYPELNAHTYTHYGIIGNNDFLAEEMYFYDFEDTILNLKQDEIAPNSPYETGARFFAYLHHRYGDFCSWMKDESFNTTDLEQWKTLLKAYYKNDKIFDEFYSYEQSFGDKYNLFCGANNFSNYGNYYSPKDFSNEHKLNYYFNFGNLKDYQGNQTIIYKDLYLNINSAKDQLTKLNISTSNLKLKTDKDIEIKLYNSVGTLIKTITNSSEEFSLTDVAFIRLVGNGVVSLYLTY